MSKYIYKYVYKEQINTSDCTKVSCGTFGWLMTSDVQGPFPFSSLLLSEDDDDDDDDNDDNDDSDDNGS